MTIKTLRKTLLTLTLLCAMPAFAAPEPGADAVKIVAIVNDQVISSLDLADRTTLLMSLSGIPDTEENRNKLTPQVLRQLMDEKLQMQDAAAHSLTVTDTKVDEAIAKIEKQNNKAPGSLEKYLVEKHLSRPSFIAQVKAQVAWGEIITKEIRPKIRVSDQEVARYKKNSAPDEIHDEVMINVIRLPVDTPANEDSVSKFAGKLADEIHKGASFENIGAQFSAGAGGKAPEPFWVDRRLLDPTVAAALDKISKNGVTDPVKTGNGYQLIKLVDVRKRGAGAPAPAGAETAAPTPPQPRIELAFKQIVLAVKPVAKDMNDETFAKIAKYVSTAPGGCDDHPLSAQKSFTDIDFQVFFVRRLLSDLPDKVRDIVGKLGVGQTSEPVKTPQDVRIFKLCERVEMPPEKATAPAAPAISPEDIQAREAISQEKLELEAQKYMRGLRRDAFIEVRGL